MEKDFQKTMFYRAFMTCVFAGLIGTLLCMIFDLSFVGITNFPFSSMINVSTLIFAVNIAFLVVGALYYWSVRFFKKGEAIYSTLLVLVAIFLLWKIQGFDRSNNATVNIQFRWLSSGIVLILASLAAVAVPLLYHSKKFDEYVL
ncbi:MAG TPA: hypothetical protein VL307_02100 [Chitinophagaceae bacterium]|nr:hypothetical protein [Chitinophagaceae bacterium]